MLTASLGVWLLSATAAGASPPRPTVTATGPAGPTKSTGPTEPAGPDDDDIKPRDDIEPGAEPTPEPAATAASEPAPDATSTPGPATPARSASEPESAESELPLEPSPASPTSDAAADSSLAPPITDRTPAGESKALLTYQTSWVLTGAGILSVVGGTAALATGAWNIRQSRERRDALLSALSDEEIGPRDRALATEWANAWSRSGRGLIIGGSLFAAAGIAMTTWGAIRLARHGVQIPPHAHAPTVAPVVSRDALGLHGSISF